MWASARQNQQNGRCPQQRLRSAWASPLSDKRLSSLSTCRKFGTSATHWEHSEDSDQAGRMPRLIWVFAGRTCHFVGFVMKWLSCSTVRLSTGLVPDCLCRAQTSPVCSFIVFWILIAIWPFTLLHHIVIICVSLWCFTDEVNGP